MISAGKTVFALFLFIVAIPSKASVYVGETGKFEKVVFSNEGLNINRVVGSIRIQATKNLQINYCTLHFNNGGQQDFQVGQLGDGQSVRHALRHSRSLSKIICNGSSVNLIGSRGRLKVYITQRVVGPRPRPRPRPRPLPPGPRPGPRPQPLPRVVNVRPITQKVCVKKSKKMIQLNTQAQYWKVNGAGSRLSTWKYPGRMANLTLDYATANVHAYCKRPGNETFNVQWKLAFSDPNVYQTRLTVRCVPCAPIRVVKNAQDKAKKAFRLYKRNQAELALTELRRFIRKLNDKVAEGEFTEEEVEIIQSVILEELNNLRRAIRGGYAEEVIENILLSLERL